MTQRSHINPLAADPNWEEIPEGSFDVWIPSVQGVRKGYTRDSGLDVNARLQNEINRAEYLKRGTYGKLPLKEKDYIPVNVMQGFLRAAAAQGADLYAAGREYAANAYDVFAPEDGRDALYALKLKNLEKQRGALEPERMDAVKEYLGKMFSDTRNARLRDRLAEIEKQNARMKAAISKSLGIDSEDENLATDVGAGFFQLGKSIALNIGLGGAGAIGFYAAESYPRKYAERRIAGKSLADSSLWALGASAVDGFLENWGSEVFLKNIAVKGWKSRMLKAGAGEFIEEVLQGPSDALFMNDVRGQSWREVAEEAAYSGLVAFITGSAGGALSGLWSAKIEEEKKAYQSRLEKGGLPSVAAKAVVDAAYDAEAIGRELPDLAAEALNEQVDPVKFPDYDYGNVISIARDELDEARRQNDVSDVLAERITGGTAEQREQVAGILRAHISARAAMLGATPREIIEADPLRVNLSPEAANENAAALATGTDGYSFNQAGELVDPDGRVLFQRSEAVNTIKDVNPAFSSEIDEVLQLAAQPGHNEKTVVAGKVGDALARLAADNGLSIEGYSHTVDTSAVRHMEKHGADGLPITEADIKTIPDVIGQPDYIIFGSRNRKRSDTIVFSKNMPDGSVIYVEEVRTGRKRLAANTMYKMAGRNGADFSKVPGFLTSETVPGQSLKIIDVKEEAVKVFYQRASNTGAFDPGNPNIYYSGDENGTRGYYDRERRLVQVLESGDVDTIIHELMGHQFTIDYVEDAIRLDKAGQLKPIMDYFKVDKPEALLSEDVQEELAKLSITYFRTQEAPTIGLRKYFEKFREWLARIWDSLIEGGYAAREDLAPEVVEFFDGLLSVKADGGVDLDAVASKREQIKKLIKGGLLGEEVDIGGVPVKDVQALVKTVLGRRPRIREGMTDAEVAGARVVIERQDEAARLLSEIGVEPEEALQVLQAAAKASPAVAGQVIRELRDELRRTKKEASRFEDRAMYEHWRADEIIKSNRWSKSRWRRESQETQRSLKELYAGRKAELEREARDARQRLEDMRSALIRQALEASQGDADLRENLLKRITAAPNFKSLGDLAADVAARREAFLERRIHADQDERITKIVKATKPYASGEGKMDITSNRIAKELREIINGPRYGAAERLASLRPETMNFLKGKYAADIDPIENLIARVAFWRAGGWRALQELGKIKDEYPMASDSGLAELYDAAVEQYGYFPSAALGDKLIADLEEFAAFGKVVRAQNVQARAKKIEDLKTDILDNIESRKDPGLVQKGYLGGFGDWNSMLSAMFGKKMGELYDMAVEQQDAQYKTEAYIDENVVAAGMSIYGLENKAQFLRRMQENGENVATVVAVVGVNPKTGRPFKYKVSKNEIIYYRNHWMNERTRESLVHFYGEEQMKSLFAMLTPQDVEFADALLRVAGSRYDAYNEVYVRLFDIDAPKLKGVYFPRRSEHDGDTELLGDFMMPSDDPNFLKHREPFTLVRPADAFSIVRSNIAGTFYITEVAEKYKTIRETFGSAAVKNAVEVKFGKLVAGQYARIIEGMSLNANRAFASGLDQWYSKVIGKVSLAKVGLNPKVFLAQLASVTNYSTDVKDGSFSRRLLANLASPGKTLEFMNSIPEVKEFVEKRLGAGYNENIAAVLSETPGRFSPRADLSYRWSRALSSMTRYGDIMPVIFGGAAMIRSDLEAGVSMSEAVARFKRATLRSQQSSTAATLSPFQQNGGAAYRLLNVFQNTANQYMRKMGDAMIAYHNGDITAKEFAKIEANYLVLQPSLYALTGVIYYGLWDFAFGGDDDDEEDSAAMKILGEIISAPVAAVPFVRDNVKSMFARLSGAYYPRAYSVLFWDDLMRAQDKLFKEDMNLDGWAAVLQPFIEGATSAPVGTARRMLKTITKEAK
jgi:hypothetical protein